ncbi:hybrid sensor histidine kinase/response regulator [Tahibacter amnicola]|uniref:histidine kinase n=1 Tax=Tahibacter amnicola TaxID=2976241 RepID=A0ABY6BL82_9GAMM|nr:hybrid sensor histidine kinase/response regulator [Tahibacter amnicola]UXI70381.1 response regulator [Tahibacter amnicola]
MNGPVPVRVLVVEDERLVAKDLQATLIAMGYDAFAIAASAEEAFRQAEAKRPDVVLMDIRIQGAFDGIHAADTLMAAHGCAVVYLTAHADEETIARAKKTGPFGYLLKPIKSAELRGAVEVAVYRLDAERRLRERTQQLEVLNRDLEAFNASLSHEVRGPLRHIFWYSELLQQQCEEILDVVGMGYVHRIRHAAVSLTTLVGDLLKLASVTRHQLLPERLNLTAMTRDIAERMIIDSGDDAGEILVQDGMTVLGDRPLLQIMMANLLGSAWAQASAEIPLQIDVGAIFHRGEFVYFVCRRTRTDASGDDVQILLRESLTNTAHAPSDAEIRDSQPVLGVASRIAERHGGRMWNETVPGRVVAFFTLRSA